MRKYLIIKESVLFRGTILEIYGTKTEFSGTD